MADRNGVPIDANLTQPAPGSGTPQPPHDGREYWRREAARLRLRLADMSAAAMRHERETWAVVVAWLAHEWEREVESRQLADLNEFVERRYGP